MRTGRLEECLAETDRLLAEDRASAVALGLDLLRGDLLERLSRPRDAAEQFARALSSVSPLAPWARWRLALLQERMGHAEVAAGLVATLLARSPPAALAARGIALLDSSIDAGGDCRLLGGLPVESFSGESRRIRELIEIRCARRAGAPSDPAAIRRFLENAADDAVAWDAAQPLLGSPEVAADRATALLVGLTAYHHRDFPAAVQLLAPWNAVGTRGPFDQLGHDAAYAEARSAFWLARFAHAADLFQAIALKARDNEARADAWYQRARALELNADVDGAHDALLRALAVDTRGSWAGTALVSLLRLEYLQGDLPAARRRLTELSSSPSFARHTARGALFLAVSELVRGRTSRVASWLASAEQSREISAIELAYWRARYFEALGEETRAFDLYIGAMFERPFHPLAESARRRLATPRFARHVANRITAGRSSNNIGIVWSAAALASSPALGSDLAERGRRLLASQHAAADWLDARPVPVAEWPLWRDTFDRPEELLLGIGLAAESAATVRRHFPGSSSRLALTGAQWLIDEGATRSGIALSEAAFSRLPRNLPVDWVAFDWLRTLYPLPWANLIRTQATTRAVDPSLLAAVIREESRFDPRAISPAAARGLTQMILPTASRLAQATGIGKVTARNLLDPLVSIPLGAGYLAELSRRFQGQEVAIAAAYNAGEDQTALWQRYCLTAEPEELMAKIGFAETRAYVSRVLESRNAYAALAAAGP